MTDPRPPSRIDVDGSALRANLRSLREAMEPSRLVMVVKGHAYGHGYHTTVPVAAVEGIRDFAVFSAHEAIHVLRQAPEGTRVQVMGYQDAVDLPYLARRGIEVWINDVHDVNDVQGCRGLDVPLGVHVEVETGMYRMGLAPEGAVEAARMVADHDDLRLAGLCTHLAGAEDPQNDARVHAQVERFQDVREALLEAGLEPPCHVASSSAALRWPEYRMDMVRIGIASYGLWPTPFVRETAEDRGTRIRLRQALTWRTRIVACKDVPAGAHVGYGRAYTADQDMRIGIAPVGYADGFTRLLSMEGHVLVRGGRCPLVGQVNMNMVQIDVTGTSAVPGDEVVLVGHQGDETIGVHSFAEMNEVVNYEFMARLSWDVPRSLAASQPEPAAGSTPGVR